MKRQGLDLGGMINPLNKPVDTGIPQRGAEPTPVGQGGKKPRSERRSDQMSVRMRPSIRAAIEQLAEDEGEPIAEIVERAIVEYLRAKDRG